MPSRTRTSGSSSSSAVAPGCVSIADPQFTAGAANPAHTGKPTQTGKHTLVSLSGPGLFVSANVAKQGGGSGLTSVVLSIDGRDVLSSSFVGALNYGLDEANPYGLRLLSGPGGQSFAIGWPFPLAFKKDLKLAVDIKEDGVVQVFTYVVHGKCP